MQKQKTKSRLQRKLYEVPKAQAQWKTYTIAVHKNIFIHIASLPSYSMMSLRHAQNQYLRFLQGLYMHKILGTISLCVQ